jgi:hypothetical protein
MKIKYLSILSVLFLAGFVLLSVSPVLADTEPNNSLMEAEVIGEGTFTGNVSTPLTAAADVDYYMISVPKDKDIEVTITKTDAGTGMIDVESYDHDKSGLGVFGIWMLLETQGETQTDSWYNSDDSAQNIYIEISGDGDYTMTIEFTDKTSEAVEGFLQACCFGTLGIILIFILGIVGIIILIIVVVKMFGKKKK